MPMAWARSASRRIFTDLEEAFDRAVYRDDRGKTFVLLEVNVVSFDDCD